MKKDSPMMSGAAEFGAVTATDSPPARRLTPASCQRRERHEGRPRRGRDGGSQNSATMAQPGPHSAPKRSLLRNRKIRRTQYPGERVVSPEKTAYHKFESMSMRRRPM